MWKFVLGLLISLTVSAQVWASEAGLLQARTLLDQGEYDQAIAEAQALQSAEGLILASESLSAKVMLGYVDSPKNESKKARKWAAEALELAPNSQDARVQFALAYGFETRSSGPFRAWRKRLPQKTLAAIEEVRSLYPDDPRGSALLGAWHLGIIRKAGDENGEKWFGASEAQGIEYYELALSQAPGDIVIASNYALILLAIDLDKHMEKAAGLIRDLAEWDAQNATEAEVQMRMIGLLDYSDMDDLKDRVETLLDG